MSFSALLILLLDIRVLSLLNLDMFYELGFDAIQLTITCSKSTMKHTNLINVFTGRCHYDGVSPYIIAKKTRMVMMSLLLTLTHVAHKSSVSPVTLSMYLLSGIVILVL